MILPSRLSHFPLNKGHEGIPIPVHLDASKLKECLCPFLDPTHASVVQALVDHMLDRPLDRAGGQCLGLSTAPRRKGVDLSGVFARMHRCARSTAGSARPPPSRALPAGKSARSNTILLILVMPRDCRPTSDLLPSEALPVRPDATPLLRGAVLSTGTGRLLHVSQNPIHHFCKHPSSFPRYRA